MSLGNYLSSRGTTVPTEVRAGTSTFATMVYIIIVQPAIMAGCGMPQEAVFTATIISTVLATLAMGLWAKLPFALSTAMGTNAIFAYSIVVPGLATWQEALGMIFVSGVIFMILSFPILYPLRLFGVSPKVYNFSIREKVVDNIPEGLKDGLGPAIGIFLMMLGLGTSGMNLAGNFEGTLGFANLKNPPTFISFLCLIFTLFIYFYQRTKQGKTVKVTGAVLIGIIVTTAALIISGNAPAPAGIMSTPPSITPILFQIDIAGALQPQNWIYIFIFFLGDFFSTAGTLIACGRKAGLYDPTTGKMPGTDRAFRVDATGTVVGSLLGCSTITTFVESASGVEDGGRTGLTSVTTAAWFFLALFFSPIFLSIPAAASGVALVVVGFSMFFQVFELDKTYTGVKPAESVYEGTQCKYSNLDKVPIIAVIAVTAIANDFAVALCFGLILYGVNQIIACIVDKAIGVPPAKIIVPGAMTFVLLILAILKFTVTL
jgi:AGZA family xanthine/uracil permease-like MFS transporter